VPFFHHDLLVPRRNALPSASRRPDATTNAPFLAKATAVARPMPVNAPVINTTGLLILGSLIVIAMATSRLDQHSIGRSSWRRGLGSRQLTNGFQHEIPKITRIVLALSRQGNNPLGNHLNCWTIAVS
jgi:hypothetical protein